MEVELRDEHRWLEQLVGEWTSEMEGVMGPGEDPVRHTGTETVRSLKAWVLCEGRGEMPGGGIGTTVMTLGYDPAKQRFVGTFIGSMMTNMWVYEGQLDDERRVLTLDTEGPDFGNPGRTAKYRDRILLDSDDERRLTSSYLGEDGEWHEFLEARYQRVG